MEKKIYGYAGKLLFVDLSTGSIREEALKEEDARNFIGGYGLGAKVLFDMVKPGADPLGPENVVGFIPGLLTATGTYMSGRYMVVSKSPVTGGFNDANSGGYFGPELKRAGYDGVFVSGEAASPVYIWINDGKVEIRDASKLWGMDSKEVELALKELTGEPKLRAAVIGPAGEKLSLMAGIMNDGHRAAARGGTGAVMGSKKLKALAVRGTGTIEIADPEKFKEINKRIAEQIKNPPEGFMGDYVNAFKTLGTAATTPPSVLSGDAPVKNWAGVGIVDFGEDSAQKIGSASFDSRYSVKKYACANCPLACGAEYKVTDGKWPLGDTERPEYETLASFGSNCMNDDIESIFKCNELCNRNGLDTISVGSTVAWVMECFENRLLTKEDLDGIDATWGNPEAIVALTEKIISQEGIGKTLALGQAGAAKKLGFGSEYLTAAMGIELGMHDPRLQRGYARTYQYDPTPGRHVKGGGASFPLDMPGWAQMDVGGAGNMDLTSSAGLCMFTMFAYPQGAMYEMISAVTGWEFDQMKAFTTGTRIFTMRHAYNMREGIRRADYVIAGRVVGKPPLTVGPTAGSTIDNEALGDGFFKTLGWNIETGIPEAATLQALGGLENVISALYPELG